MSQVNNSIKPEDNSKLLLLPELLDDLDHALLLCRSDTLQITEYNLTFFNWYSTEFPFNSLDDIFDEDIIRRIKNAVSKKT